MEKKLQSHVILKKYNKKGMIVYNRKLILTPQNVRFLQSIGLKVKIFSIKKRDKNGNRLSTRYR